MIAGVSGRLTRKEPGVVWIDTGGVWYECLVSLSTLAALPELGDTARLFVHTHVREDALLLFGFSEIKEKELFLLLSTVKGIGPKVALNMLSALDVEAVITALHQGDLVTLNRVPGIGKKTAERLVLELKDKVQKLFTLDPAHAGSTPHSGEGFAEQNDLESALLGLGYKPKDVEKVTKTLLKTLERDCPIETLIREALRELNS